jgi:NTP pyrophosphatase (non-canonical NTP hydrolase)
MNKKEKAEWTRHLDGIIEEVRAERHSQLAKWGKQAHTLADWHLILSEEVGEVAKATLEGGLTPPLEPGHKLLCGELIQVAAVALATVQTIRNGPA